MENTLRIRSTRALPTIAMAVLTFLAAGASAQSDEVLNLDIKAQNAGSALVSLAQSSGVQIMLTEGSGEQVEVDGLKGEYRFEDALAALLTDTGLTYEYASENLVLVQQAQEAEEEASGEAEEEVLELKEQRVTGSRLRDTLGGAPVFVLTREEIKQRGFGSVEDIGRSLSQNFSEVNAAAARDNSINSVDAMGQSMINLRGFGESSTLVLVNGRRWPQASSFGNGAVNINGIPFSAIERVEVLTDGASAIYGADAQAGVVNFILRDDYQGGETLIRYDMGAHEGDSKRLEQTLSTSWDGGRAMLSLSYLENEAIDSRKAGLTSSDFSDRGGRDNRTQPGSIVHRGQPGVAAYGIPLGFYNIVISPLGALPQGDDGTGGVFSRLSQDNLVPWDNSAQSANESTSNSERLSGHLSVDQEFFDGKLELYGELSFDYSDSWAHRGAPSYSGVVPSTNPYNDIPPHPFFSTVVSYVFANEYEAGLLDPISNDSDQNNRRVTLGFRTELPFRDWIADFSATRGKEESWYLYYNLDTDLLTQRIAGVDSAGNPLPSDQIINPFGDGTGQSAAAMAGLVAPFYGEGGAHPNWNFSRQDDYSLSVDGSLFSLPGGDVQLGVGGENRTETLDYSDDQSRGTLFSVTDPERKIGSYFAELGLPLVGEKNRMAGLHSLGMKLAVRSDEYSFSGPFGGPGSPYTEKTFDRVSPKLELAWYPVSELKLRASWGESFVPPASSRLFGVENGPFNWLALVDIENPQQGLLFPDAYFTGNPDLEPEISETLSVGFDWTPGGILDGFSLKITWFDTEFTDKFGSGFSLAFNEPELFFAVPNAVIRDAQGNIVRVNLFTVNLAQRFSENLDVNLRYQFDTDRWGFFTIGTDATFTGKLQDVSAPGSEPNDLHGTPAGPERWKGSGYVNWALGIATLNLTANYSSSYAGLTFSPQDRVENYLTFDLTGSYEFGNSGWKIYAGARNIANKEFPFYDSGYQPWDPRRVDARGRVVHLEIRKTYNLF